MTIYRCKFNLIWMTVSILLVLLLVYGLQITSKSAEPDAFLRTDAHMQAIRDAALTTDQQLPQKDPVLKQDMTPLEVETEFYRFLARIELPCPPSIRAGHYANGGWDVCMLEPYQPKQPCIVYSFGIADDWSFDDDMAVKYGCTVKSFDPSLNLKDHQRGALQWFYSLGLAGRNRVNEEGWELKTMGTLLADFQEDKKIIDYLKFDIEGSEWESLEQMLVEKVLHRVKQLGFEVHFAKNSSPEELTTKWRILQKLHQLGFRRWHFHENAVGRFRSERANNRLSTWFEMVYVNTAFLDKKYTPPPLNVTRPSSSFSGSVPQLLPTRFHSDTFVLLEQPDILPLQKHPEPSQVKRFAESRGITCPTHKRLGKLEHKYEGHLDEGWDLCTAPPFELRAPCVVYSFLIGDKDPEFHFDDELVSEFGCSVKSFLRSNITILYRRGPLLEFNNGGLASSDRRPDRNCFTFAQILEKYRHAHKEIDVLRFGSSGEEWQILNNMLQDKSLTNIKQLLFEADMASGRATDDQRTQIFRDLQKAGFVKWSSHPKRTYERSTTLFRFSYVNTAFLQS